MSSRDPAKPLFHKLSAAAFGGTSADVQLPELRSAPEKANDTTLPTLPDLPKTIRLPQSAILVLRAQPVRKLQQTPRAKRKLICSEVGAQLNQQYLSSRPQCLTTAKQLADRLGLAEALGFDAILKLDRMLNHCSDLFNQDAVSELVGASLVLATRYGLDQPQPVLDTEALAALFNVPTGDLINFVKQIEGVCQSLPPTGSALVVVSAVRCLNVYLKQLGSLQPDRVPPVPFKLQCSLLAILPGWCIF
ncbi:hypothetical protein WJX77_002105 [Trebouxia sp. C0004]